MIALLMLVVLGVGLVLYKEIQKKNTASSPLLLTSPAATTSTITPAATSAVVPPTTTTEDIISTADFDQDDVRDQFKDAGMSNSEIDDFFEWLDTAARTTNDVNNYLASYDIEVEIS